jgi:hypothetical protein
MDNPRSVAVIIAVFLESSPSVRLFPPWVVADAFRDTVQVVVQIFFLELKLPCAFFSDPVQ